MGDSEAVLGLDGLKEGLEAEAGQRMRPSVSSCSSRGSQMEVKLPWYMGITCKVGLLRKSISRDLTDFVKYVSIKRIGKFSTSNLVKSLIFDVCRM